MSLIRGTSNPECLYVWGDGEFYNWSSNQHPTDTIPRVPERAFDAFVRRILRHGNLHDDHSWKGLSIRERYCIDMVAGWSPVVDERRRTVRAGRGAYRWVLTYKRRHIATMWQTTWFYILTQNKWKS